MFDNIVMSLIQYYSLLMMILLGNSTSLKGGSIVDILSKIRISIALNITLIWYLVIVFTLVLLNTM
ncbi:hypothetical protein [Methanobrevibacter sp.]|uniref:hypothetical protein n=1 Tax=Methanobrevibacter sp. TaxID=66852 RepID=UPI00386EB06D